MLKVFIRDGEGLCEVGELTSGQVCGGFKEDSRYLIRKPSPDMALFVDDEPLSSDADNLFWEWSPGFYAGQVMAELQVQGEYHTHQFLLDVSPHPSKAGHELFTQYIADVADYAPELLLGKEPATQGLSGQSSFINVWVAYARLRAFAPQYLRAMRAVIAQPITRLSHYRERLPIHQARNMDVTTILRLASNAPLLATMVTLAKGNAALDVLLDDTTVDVPFNEPTVDNPANQQMLRQLRDIIRRVEWVITKLESYREQTSDTETGMLNRIPRRVRCMKDIWRELTNIARHHPFDCVTARGSSAAGLNAVSGHTRYAHAHQFGAKLLRHGASRLDEEEMLYVGPTWQIYEAWCFCTLAKSLENTFPGYQWRRRESSDHKNMFVEGKGNGIHIRLYLQLVCPSDTASKTHGYYSISRERRPDLVLEVTKGDHVRFTVLDAKYMASRRSVMEAMSSAHIYRDSLKRQEQSPTLSLLLIPASREVADLTDENYREKYSEGCFELSTAESAKHLLEIIRKVMVEMQ